MNSKTATFIYLGFELTGLVLGSVFLGNVLDSHFRLKGIFIAALIVISFASWVVHLVKVLKKHQNQR